MKPQKENLIKELSQIIDGSLGRQLVESYSEMQRRFLLQDWKPTELDGGQFCESIARAFYQLDSGHITNSQLPGEIISKLLDKSSPHRLDVKDRSHFSKTLSLVYKFRSDRGAIHISPRYSANHLDATLLIYGVKWLLSDFLRISMQEKPEKIAELIEAIIEIETPLIHTADGIPLVLDYKVRPLEEVLVQLFFAKDGKLPKKKLYEYTKQGTTAINGAVAWLIKKRLIRKLNDQGKSLMITPTGRKFVIKNISPKLEL